MNSEIESSVTSEQASAKKAARKSKSKSPKKAKQRANKKVEIIALMKRVKGAAFGGQTDQFGTNIVAPRHGFEPRT